VKVVDVSEFYSERGGGVRSHLTTRGHFLCALGHDHTVVAPGPRDEVSMLDANAAPRREGAKVVRVAGPALPYDATYHWLTRFDKIRALVGAERPDVLEAHSPYLGAAAVLACGRAGCRVRTAFWHADHLSTYVEPRFGRLARAVAPGLLRALLAPFDATFVAGTAQARRLRSAGVRNVEHVPLGVDTRTFHPGARSATLRQELMAGRPGALLVGAGRLALEKRWDVVLDAVARLRTSGWVGALVLFGDGPERARLEQRAGPGVSFVGFEKDRARFAAALASADVLVHGCPYETFGLGVAEAVACAVPVVVPDRGGAAERADPLSGQLYASLDPQACAEAIRRVLGRNPADLRTHALAAAATTVSAESHFALVLGIYDALLRERAGRHARSS
jgi:alpha-1,6-mannosyltransferase